MSRVSRGWVTVTLIITFLSLVFLTPTFFGEKLPQWWGKVFPKKGLRLGLDLRGGVFLVLGVSPEKAIEYELSSIKEDITSSLKDKKIVIKRTKIEGKSITVVLFSPADLKNIGEILENYRQVARIAMDEQGPSFTLTLMDSQISNVQEKTIDQVIQVIRNRIDEFGVLEPVIQKRGANRILIQIPGASSKDRERIIDIIRRTAVLEFKIVREAAPDRDSLLAKNGIDPTDPAQVEGASKALAEKGLAVHPGDETAPVNEKFFITNFEPGVTGECLSDAKLTFDELGRPAVGFNFKAGCASKFGDLTENNKGKRLAIVLDGVVKSAPNIRDRITTSGIITGVFTPEEARDLSLVLRSGALPVPVDIEQERTVGPSLGRDSIEKGRLSMIVGGIMVLVFMIIYYRLQGFVADIALGLNMLFIMGFLSSFGVTLTLPGIAGLVLTLGIAVDGNIIIFERIKEEIRVGKTPVASIDAGYARSLWTVLDANITTLLTAIILFWFGSGPIKGFAVTLSIGIISTVFCNVVVARQITNFIYGGRKEVAVSI
ncbi:MAG: protein translocase subunit SecD [Thermodesulfobacteriota bacterium]